MIFDLFRKSAPEDAVYAVYAGIVAQSRQQRFYAQWGVPDTVTGRFDMISIHVALMLRRFRNEGQAAQRFAQALTELFFKDMDRSLREMGVGDLSVPKKIKQMGNVFYGLLGGLDGALSANDPAELRAIIARNIFAAAADDNAAALADYIAGEARALAAQPVAGLMVPRVMAAG